MSYILEALKKSEQERQIGHPPDISMVQEVQRRSAARWPRWVLAALLLNVLVLVVIAWRPWEAHKVQRVDGAVAPASTPPVAATPEGQAVTPDTPTLPEPAGAPVSSLPDKASATALPTPVTQMPLPAPVVQDPIETEVEPELPPRWQDLPLEERNSLPLPRIDVHVFAREPARRFVLINLRKYQEGDTVDGGATLESILADGIVLSYQGQRYRVDRP